MKLRPRLLAAAIGCVVLTCTLLAGCGGGGGTGTTGTGTTEGKNIDDDAGKKMFEGNTEQPAKEK